MTKLRNSELRPVNSVFRHAVGDLQPSGRSVYHQSGLGSDSRMKNCYVHVEKSKKDFGSLHPNVRLFVCSNITEPPQIKLIYSELARHAEDQ